MLTAGKRFRPVCFLVLLASAGLGQVEEGAPGQGEPARATQDADLEGELDDLSALQKLRETLEALQRGSEPAYSPEEAEAMMNELLPLVEQAAGRTFHAPPAYVLADTATVSEALAVDLAPQLQVLGQGLSPEDAADVAQKRADAMAPMLLGKWGFQDQKIFLLPRRVEPVLSLLGLEKEYEQAIVKLVVAHELVHALQDQEVELAERFARTSDTDAAAAFNALIEGHAVFVADQVGRQLGLTPDEIEATNRLLAGDVSLGDPMVDMLGQMAGAVYEQIYLGGAKFSAYHHEQGGTERLWEIFEAPPSSTAMIARPESYATGAEENPDLSQALQGLESLLGEGPWTVQHVDVGNVQLASVYGAMEATDREKILDQVVQTQALVASKPDNRNQMGSISLIRLRDAEFAGDYIQILKRFAEVNTEKIGQSPLIEITRLEILDVEDFECDAGQMIFLDMLVLGSEVSQRIFRVVRNGVMVELIASELDLDDQALLSLAEEAFERHTAAVHASQLQPGTVGAEAAK